MSLRRTARLLVVLALLFSAVVATAAAGSAQPDDDSNAIRLKAAEFVPDRAADRGVAPVNAQGKGYYIVQMDGPILQTQADALRDAGADLVAYVPDFAYKVRMNPASADSVAGLDGVAWVGVFEAEYKLSPDLAAEGLYRIRFERDADIGAAVAEVVARGVAVQRADHVIAVHSDLAALQAIAAIADVAWIENYTFREKHNEFGAGVIVGANTANAAGYDGSTQIVAVADTGIGDGTAAGAHPDIPSGRIVAVEDWASADSPLCYTAFPDGAQDVDSGHGTHVAVSVVGDGDATGLGQGTAPGASLVLQAVEDYIEPFGLCGASPNGYYLTGLPEDLQDLLQSAFNLGARIHSDSWGSSVAGEYTADSASADDFMWDNPTFLMTTSAGNAGTDANSNGVVDDDSIGSPATAKNLLTVGASENDRQGDWQCDSGIGNGCTGQNSIFTYGSAWPTDYPAPPLSNDPSAGNAEQMAAFSSRGPTDDGRIKPDVVAPGTWILSGYSDLFQEGYDGVVNPQNGAFQYDGWGFPASEQYKYMGGTSMSNPITAGAAAVVRDYYNKAHGHEASGALTKASLINSAVDLLDENNDGADDNDFPIPNSHEGWGRIDVADSVDGTADFVDDVVGVTTGGSAVFNYDVPAGAEFRVTLAYTDFASTETAAINLVNDLDLTVTGPSGTFLGNVFAGGFSTAGGTEDRLNNVENVYIQSAAAGTYTVTVSGFNVPFGPQPFALVVDGGGDPGPIDPVASFTSSCTDLDCDFTDTSTDADGTVVSWDWDFGDGNTSTAQNPSNSYVAAGSYLVTLTVTDNDGLADSTSSTVNVTEPGTNDPPVASFTSSCTDLDCDFTDTSTDSDGTVVAWDWDFGDGNTSTAQNPSNSYAAAGSYLVTLTVTDNEGATGETSSSVDATDPPTGTDAHVGDLDGLTTDTGRRWSADVTVFVHDDAEAPVEGATVDGTWSSGANGPGSCSTDATGSCTISKSGIRDSSPSVTFTVDTVSHGSLAYDAAANHDPDGDSDGTAIVVLQVPVGNEPPVASFTTLCSLGLCAFDGTASFDPDGTIVSYDWDFGDGGTDTGEFGTHTYTADGTYIVTLTVTDDEGATGTATDTVIVGDPPVENVHVGDLDSVSDVRGSGWRATVTVTVHDENDVAVDGATVDGTWSDGITGSGSCVTDGAGQCTISSPRIGSGVFTVTFTVDGITAGSAYDPAANHDPDGDSDGTSISIAQ